MLIFPDQKNVGKICKKNFLWFSLFCVLNITAILHRLYFVLCPAWQYLTFELWGVFIYPHLWWGTSILQSNLSKLVLCTPNPLLATQGDLMVIGIKPFQAVSNVTPSHLFFLFYRIGIKAFQAVSNVTSTNFFFFVLQMAQQLAKTAGSGVSNLYPLSYVSFYAPEIEDL